MYLRSGLLALALLAACAAGLSAWSERQQVAIAEANIRRLQDERNRAVEDSGRNLATADKLKSELERERNSQAKLLVLQNELSKGLAQREHLIETLKHENQQLRDWAAQSIPDAARRLRERPSLTGADAYRQWLSGGDAVPTAADSTEAQR
ncbi:Rz-like lysis system protein LysB [Pseudomonas fulva]|uniref:Rz-like lysis system protein LysB n=1 Tax=Pseudomonas fulva TaxID=47880 RepID=UPI000D9926A9|nr:Rz-like lysis system protein LysB [Pseudomonas sp. N2-11]MCP3788916.1 Rz-like lysis system protein LysB [Pseudomonas sp. N2-11]PYB93582.1 LysB family transcriptional regulator [Pseudomonas fulva]PYC16407.1 LysB family transcriptional regulator [Pseudomonas fulva]